MKTTLSQASTEGAAKAMRGLFPFFEMPMDTWTRTFASASPLPDDFLQVLKPEGFQAEVDNYWDALTADGGAPSQCGWLKDRFGLSWQIVPRQLIALLKDPDPGRAQRAMEAMLQMKKIDIAAVERAADGG